MRKKPARRGLAPTITVDPVGFRPDDETQREDPTQTGTDIITDDGDDLITRRRRRPIVERPIEPSDSSCLAWRL